MDNDNDFNVIELSEKEDKGELKLNGTLIKGMTGYNIKRCLDSVEISINITLPKKNFLTY